MNVLTFGGVSDYQLQWKFCIPVVARGCCQSLSNQFPNPQANRLTSDQKPVGKWLLAVVWIVVCTKDINYLPSGNEPSNRENLSSNWKLVSIPVRLRPYTLQITWLY